MKLILYMSAFVMSFASCFALGYTVGWFEYGIDTALFFSLIVIPVFSGVYFMDEFLRLKKREIELELELKIEKMQNERYVYILGTLRGVGKTEKSENNT